jgi:diguanylate cyclase (GGDEF)-like protein/PAS domain S-box-containing protein
MLMMLVDADGVVEGSSAALSRILGHDQEGLERHPITDIIDPGDHGVWATALRSLREETSGATVTVDLLFRHHDGSGKPMAITIKNLLDDPTVNALIVSGHDVSDRVAAERALRSTNSVLSATLESTADGILVVDVSGELRSANRRFTEMWRIPPEAEGDSKAIFRWVCAQVADPDEFMTRVNEVSADNEVESHDVIEFKDGRVFERDSLPQRIDGRVVGRVWSFRDITEHRVLRDELTRQAFHDALTGLANQALFRNRVEHAVARIGRTGGNVAVLFVDLDDFKTVNDSLGHPIGDELLIAVSDRLRTCLRPSDTAARLGGDEFAVLIEDLGDDRQATSVAERIVASLREPVMLAGRRVSAGASVGIAFAAGGDGLDASDLLRNADLAMYTAKARGKSCYRVFAPEMHDAAVERLEVEAHLRGAAMRGELVVHYQPIFEMGSGEIHAVESLVRWQHPERGLLGPGAFIPLAEETGLIDEIGTHVLEESLAQIRRWEDEVGPGNTPAINVNLSPHQLLDRWLPERINAMLARFGVRPSRLILEITEGALMADPKMATQNLHRLSGLGVRLAVDDFGTGYSSLAYLQRFPIDYLKIDGSFVKEILTPAGSRMVEVIVQLSHTLGLVPIAEGVEGPAQAEALDDFGCDLAQGYHLARPIDADAVSELIATKRAAMQR